MGGLLDDVPLLGEAEDAAGTVATGAVDTVIADPGNALLGVNADNMGVFEEQAAGSKVVTLGTLGLGGEGGLLTDILAPGQGAPGSEQGTGLGNDADASPSQSGLPIEYVFVLVLLVVGVGWLLLGGDD